MRVILLRGRMLGDEARNHVGFEDAAPLAALRKERLAHEGREPAAQPVCDRHAETHLAPFEILGRQQPFQHALLEILRRQSAQLIFFRQTRGKLDDVMI